MTRQNIGIGSAANDGNGDTLRQAGTKINANFREIYTFLADSNNLSTQISLENDAVVFEGSTANGFEIRLKAKDATADRDIILPNVSGNLVLDSATQTLTNKTLTTPVISSISNGGTVTIPSGADTIVTRTSTDTLTNKTIAGATLIHPKLGTTLEDSNGNEFIKFTTTTNAVNEITITNNVSNSHPSIAASGNNANINLSLSGKGTGSVSVAKAAFSSQTRTTNGAASTSATFIIGNKGSQLDVSLADGTTVGEYKIFTNKGAGAMHVTPANYAQGTKFVLAQFDGCTCIWDGTNWFLVGNQSSVTVS